LPVSVPVDHGHHNWIKKLSNSGFQIQLRFIYTGQVLTSISSCPENPEVNQICGTKASRGCYKEPQEKYLPTQSGKDKVQRRQHPGGVLKKNRIKLGEFNSSMESFQGRGNGIQ
jgi:hypothetical protein